jgi:hypothetical protein
VPACSAWNRCGASFSGFLRLTPGYSGTRQALGGYGGVGNAAQQNWNNNALDEIGFGDAVDIGEYLEGLVQLGIEVRPHVFTRQSQSA